MKRDSIYDDDDWMEECPYCQEDRDEGIKVGLIKGGVCKHFLASVILDHSCTPLGNYPRVRGGERPLEELTERIILLNFTNPEWLESATAESLGVSPEAYSFFGTAKVKIECGPDQETLVPWDKIDALCDHYGTTDEVTALQRNLRKKERYSPVCALEHGTLILDILEELYPVLDVTEDVGESPYANTFRMLFADDAVPLARHINGLCYELLRPIRKARLDRRSPPSPVHPIDKGADQ